MPRTRSASAHQKVLKAALELVAEHGIDGTSMDAVARESGVSKATIYKHWADKETIKIWGLGRCRQHDWFLVAKLGIPTAKCLCQFPVQHPGSHLK